MKKKKRLTQAEKALFLRGVNSFSTTPPAHSCAHERARIDRVISAGGATDCGVCEQHVMDYFRQIGASPAAAVVLLDRECARRERKDPGAAVWVDWPELCGNQPKPKRFAGGDKSKLAFWGIVEAKQAVRGDGSKRVGLYRITPKGRRFVAGRISVPQYAIVYNEVCLAIIGPPVTIHDALADKFRYDELMGYSEAAE